MAKRVVVVVALVAMTLGIQVAPASALPGWYIGQFACEGITVYGSGEQSLAAPPTIYITELEGLPKKTFSDSGGPYESTTVAHWGVRGYMPYVGHEFARSRVLVTHLSLNSLNNESRVLIDEPVPSGQVAVTCEVPAYNEGPTVAEIVFLDPIPAPPPSVVYASRNTLTPLAAQGTYEDRIVRSDSVGGDGCFVASPSGDYARLEKFCVADVATTPALFDMVDVAVSPDLVAVATPADSTLPPPPPDICANSADYFADDAGLLYEAAINCLYRYQLVRGYSADAFGPNDLLLRQHTASMLVNFVEKTLGTDLPTASSGLRDIAGNTHEENINKGFAAAIINGFVDNTFRPMTLVSREQFVTLLVQSTEDLLGRALEADGTDTFIDDDGSVHELNIEKAHDAGILEGLPVRGDEFVRQAGVTRGEAAQMIRNALVKVLAPARAFTP
jgi:hypothetical protein